MHLALEYLANHLCMVATGMAAGALERNFEGVGGHFTALPRGMQINLKHGAGRELWEALETPFVVVRTGPRLAHDIVAEDVIPAAKRVTLTIALWKDEPTLSVVVDRPFAGARGGPYSADFELEFVAQPSSLRPENNRHNEGLLRWLRGLLMPVFPDGHWKLDQSSVGPSGAPYVDAAWPGKFLPAKAFGIDEVSITTHYDPASRVGGIESARFVFSTPASVRPAPQLCDIPPEFIFLGASPDGVSVTLLFNGLGAWQHTQIDGAIFLTAKTALPLRCTSKQPELYAGAYDAEDDDADPPFALGDIQKTMTEGKTLAGIEHVEITQAELTCRLDDSGCVFTGQATEAFKVAGIPCEDLVITFKWSYLGKPKPAIAVLRGVAMLGQPTYFRAALVWRDGWISALEANHSSQTWAKPQPLSELVKQLPEFLVPQREVSDSSVTPHLLRMDEQRRGTENDFDELIGD